MRRKRNRKRTEEMNFWQSYSDMMAALLLVFVLIIATAKFSYDQKAEEATSMEAEIGQQAEELAAQQQSLQEKETELEESRKQAEEDQKTLEEQKAQLEAQQKAQAKLQAQLEAQQATMAEQQTKMDEQAQLLAEQQTQMEEQQKLLAAQQTTLDEQKTQMAAQQKLLNAQQTTMDEQQAKMEEQQTQLATQQEQLDDLIGVRTELVEKLKQAFINSSMQVAVDSDTGAISFDSSVLFDFNDYDLKGSGQQFLEEFFPVYFDIILSEDFRDSVAEVIIEGHTDDSGSYLYNLELSQKRAFAVAEYCLKDGGLFAGDELNEVRTIVTANGRSSNDLIYTADGQVDQEASRRVEIKFRLCEEDMINQMSQILED